VKKVLTIGAALTVWLGTLGLTVGTAQNPSGTFDRPQFDVSRQDASDQADLNRRGASAENERIRRGFRISPVELNLRGKDRALVGLGSYIVNTGGCSDCHTNPPYLEGGDPFLGQPEKINAAAFLGGGTPFGPNLFSANLTPDASGRPAGLTFEEFERVMRTGIDPEDGHILQVMPWPVFGKKTDRDLRAIYEYLRAIPSLP
jgi:hypothetical protein